MTHAAIGRERIRRLQDELNRRNMAAMICLKPENSFYLSGFNPIIYSHPVVAVLPASGDPVVLVHALRDDHARASAWVDDIRLYGAWSTKRTMGPDWLAALHQILKERGVADGVLGIEEDYLPVTRLRQFEQAFAAASFENISDAIAEARLVKEPYEIDCARTAAAIADAGMAAAIACLAAGGSEREVSLAAVSAMNRYWAEHCPDVEVCDFGSLEGGFHNGLTCWTMIGDRVAINADNPTDRRPQPGEVAVIFIWAVCNGIHAENERAVAIGPLPGERQRAYEAILEIRAETAGLMKPGTAVADFFRAAASAYDRLGYRDNTPGRIGHGMGLGAHEAPSLDERSPHVLQPNMLITFEPNLRIPPWGGIQHSDTVLITQTGNEFLTGTDNGYLQV